MRTKDDDILFFANECHLLTRADLATLTGRNPKSLNESLRRLVDSRLLFARQRGRWEPTIYATHDIRKRDYFEHDMAITKIHVALYPHLSEWNQPKQKLESHLNEDAIFSLPFQDKSIKYYLELETGRNAWYQVDDKFKRYLSKRTEERFNVLFVLKDESKKTIKQMSKRAEKFLSRDKPSSWKLFLFTTLEQLCNDPLGNICSTAYDSNKYSLLPSLLK